MPPQTNATLLQISADGQTEDWDVSESTGAAVWSGSVGAYVIEKVMTNFSQSAGALKKTKDLQIILDQPFATQINSGHILTFMWRNATHSRRVIEFNGATLAGVPNYMRFHLRPEPLEIALESE